jgi:hypothetical protein
MAKKAKPVKRAKPYRAMRYGILNHVGDIWTPQTWDTPDAAAAYKDGYHAKYGGLARHKVVRVRVTVSLAVPA